MDTGPGAASAGAGSVEPQSAGTDENQVSWDWTSRYDQWSSWQADMESADSAEKARLQAQRKRDKMGALKHVSCCSDHSEEQRIYEMSPEKQLEECEKFKFEGTMFYREGQYYRAAGKFRLILVYLAYSFPELPEHVLRFQHLDTLACLSLAQCKLKTREFVEATEQATAALDRAVGRSHAGGPEDFDPRNPATSLRGDLRSAALAVYRRAQASAHRGLYSDAQRDLRFMGLLLESLSVQSSKSLDAQSGRGGAPLPITTTTTATTTRESQGATEKSAAKPPTGARGVQSGRNNAEFVSRFRSKMQRQRALVEQMARSHVLQARNMSRRMFGGSRESPQDNNAGLNQAWLLPSSSSSRGEELDAREAARKLPGSRKTTTEKELQAFVNEFSKAAETTVVAAVDSFPVFAASLATHDAGRATVLET